MYRFGNNFRTRGEHQSISIERALQILYSEYLISRKAAFNKRKCLILLQSSKHLKINFLLNLEYYNNIIHRAQTRDKSHMLYVEICIPNKIITRESVGEL